MILRHHNYQYNGGSPNVPVASGDRYYSQDQARDFWYLMDVFGLAMSDLLSTPKSILIGGLITLVNNTTINISTLTGYVSFQVYVPNSGTLPPALTTQDVTGVRVALTGQNAIVGAYGAVLDGVTINYIKIGYAESNGPNSRNRAKASGSYPFETVRSFVLTISPVAPTAYELCLGEVVGTGGSALVYTENYRDPSYGLMSTVGTKALSTNFTIKSGTGYNYFMLTLSPTITLPTAVSMLNKTITFKNIGTGAPVLTPSGGNTIDGLATVTMGFRQSLTLFSNGTNWYAKDVNNHGLSQFYARNLTITGQGGQLYQSNVNNWFMAYQVNGGWRVKFFIQGVCSNNTSNWAVAVTGLLFATSASIEDLGKTCNHSANTTLTNNSAICHPVSNTNIIHGYLTGNSTRWIFEGDFALAGPPTWVV